jgi:hypothetical protein
MTTKDRIATVFAVDPIHVFIVCPMCGKLHQHGSNGNPNLDNYGFRSPHCRIGTPYRGEYELVADEFTLRYHRPVNVTKKTLFRRYLTARPGEVNERDEKVCKTIKWLHNHHQKIYVGRMYRCVGLSQNELADWFAAHGLVFDRSIAPYGEWVISDDRLFADVKDRIGDCFRREGVRD